MQWSSHGHSNVGLLVMLTNPSMLQLQGQSNDITVLLPDSRHTRLISNSRNEHICRKEMEGRLLFLS